MKQLLIGTVAAAIAGLASANASVVLSPTPLTQAAVIDISGFLGHGITTINFSGTSTTSDADAVRTAGSSYSDGDTFQPEGLTNFLANTTIQDALYTATGNATLTIGGVTELITGIFLDSDDGENHNDDFGLRTQNELSYSAGDLVSYAGSLTIGLDISAFIVGTYLNTDPSNNNLGDLGL
ncbi:MAG: hypothetical protein HRU11_12510, partial [Parvularculaceae bacterium]|nr:hypothetical protein [Parvularculaceae bacterium]